MNDYLSRLLNDLEAVLCDPKGNVCISGSDEDRRILNQALHGLRVAIEDSRK